MTPTAPSSSLRQILEQRLTQLLLEVERLFDAQLTARVGAEIEAHISAASAQISLEARERARREFAEQLNQAVRRLRQAVTWEELGATLVDTTGAFSSGAAFFRVMEGVVEAVNIRGVSDAAAGSFRGMELSLSSAPALAAAVESRDPVSAMASAKEVSAELAELAGDASDVRAWVFPLVVRERAHALLYVWGASVQPTPIELLAQVAAAAWGVMPEAQPAPEPLTQIESVTEAPSASEWDALPEEEQQIHLRAQRFARVTVARIRLEEAEAVRAGRAGHRLYSALQEPIDTARETFRRSFFIGCPSMVDYLHLELVRTLAHDEPEFLGESYPGPMV
ncbi:MAG TPA: hypothetical protein VG675_02040 [Bryobacteraceae bacterium]|nr:hypothetical protein [Bryobacteraceae bacterium]